jgi:hypothetical protein
MKKWYLKKQYRKLYLKARDGFEDYSCGHKLLLTLSSQYYNTCLKFNEVADKLSKIDNDTPKFRFELS